MIAPELMAVFQKIMDRTSYFDEHLDEIELIDVNQNDWAGDSPLHIAALLGDVDAINILINNGAHINARGEKKLTPLHHAFMKGHVDAIETLLSRGADANAVDDFGKKPENWALEK
jgi:ankyrin repeat protein